MAVVRCNSMLLISGVLLFLLLAPSHCLLIQLESSHVGQGYKENVQVSDGKFLPRKLRVLTEKSTDTVMKNTEKDPASKKYNPEEKPIAGANKLKPKKAPAAAAQPRPGHAEILQQWSGHGGDSSEFFTMDYHRVRRRRHIHNKGLPVGP